MRQAGVLWILVVAGCVARPPAPTVAPAITGTFDSLIHSDFTSDSLYPVQSAMQGRFTIYPESVVLDHVRVSLTWHRARYALFPMRLRAIVAVLLHSPPPDDSTHWYPRPGSNTRPTAVSGVVNAGVRIDFDSLRLLVLTRRTSDLRWRAVAFSVEVDHPDACGPERFRPCTTASYPLGFVLLVRAGALPSN